MKTKRQEELVNSFFKDLGEDIRPFYQEIALHLSELGYHPHKQRSYIVFKHDKHNKQMAKMGLKKDKAQTPFFSLRFSACRGYSKKFADIVSAAVAKNAIREAQCIYNRCSYCKGEPATHSYPFTAPDGNIVSYCGAAALEVPLTENEITEIKKLLFEEHDYLMKHEAG